MQTVPMDTDMASAAELAWENEGGRLLPAAPDGDADTPQVRVTGEVATTDNGPS